MPCKRCWLDVQVKEARREREAQIAKVQMEAALTRGVSWGMAGDDQVGAFCSDFVILLGVYSVVLMHSHDQADPPCMPVTSQRDSW